MQELQGPIFREGQLAGHVFAKYNFYLGIAIMGFPVGRMLSVEDLFRLSCLWTRSLARGLGASLGASLAMPKKRPRDMRRKSRV